MATNKEIYFYSITFDAMGQISLNMMRRFLSKSISGNFNRNKLFGILAEIDFRNRLSKLGYGRRVSQGGWIARKEGPGTFGHYTSVFFPETIQPGRNYPCERTMEEPPRGLHTICSTMHQIGIHSYYCVPCIPKDENVSNIRWQATQLGIPEEDTYHPFPQFLTSFNRRGRRYNFLTYNTDVSRIPDEKVPEEFTKEHLRITFNTEFFCEISDIDGIFWGQQYTYPIEIKEKTVANNSRLGDYFGLDIGPFVKLAFYAAKRGNLHSLFVVREIDNTDERNLVNWWFITFDTMAQYASWVPMGGGQNMRGGASSVVRIPKAEFKPLTAENLALL